MTRDAFAALLLLAAAPAAAVPTTSQPQESIEAWPGDATHAIVEEMRAKILRPGEIVPGWNVGGADPDAALRARGADTHYFLIDEGEDREVTILTTRRIDDFAPARWRPVDSYGSPIAYAEDPSITFLRLGAAYFVGVRGTGYRENGLDCGGKITHAILYEDPDAPQGSGREIAIDIFRLTLLATEGVVTCVRSEGDAESGWDQRHLLPDGRDLPALNHPPTRRTIVPAAPVDTLLTATPARAPE